VASSAFKWLVIGQNVGLLNTTICLLRVLYTDGESLLTTSVVQNGFSFMNLKLVHEMNSSLCEQLAINEKQNYTISVPLKGKFMRRSFHGSTLKWPRN